MHRWFLVFISIALASGEIAGQPPTSTRTGHRLILDPAFEIALARSGAPASVSSAARVLVLTDSGYAIAATGINGVTCIVNRSWRDSMEPHCYDAEGAQSILPIEMRRERLRSRGLDESTIEQDIRDSLAAGVFHLPRRPAMSYMMSNGQVLYDDSGHLAGKWRPHIMIYYPGLTNRQMGLPATPDVTVGLVSDEGKVDANVTIMMAAFVPVTPGSPADRSR